MYLMPLTVPLPSEGWNDPHFCVQIACHTWVPLRFSKGSWGGFSGARLGRACLSFPVFCLSLVTLEVYKVA